MQLRYSVKNEKGEAMPAVQVRDLDQETYELLKASAARNRRSISQQVEYFIDEGLRMENRRLQAEEAGEQYDPVWGVRLRRETFPVFAERPVPRELTPEERIEKRKALFSRIKALPKIDLSGLPTPEEMIREDRDSRPVIFGEPEWS